MSKIIHQIWLSDKTKVPEHIRNNIKTLPKIYSGYEYKLYNNEKIVDFLKNNFSDDVLMAYNKCKPYAFKSDLARYCLLYVYGGYYFDISICPNFKYESEYNAFALNGEPTQIGDNLYHNLDNGVMFFKNKNHSFLKMAIDTSVYNILNHKYGNWPLDITGPMMLHKLKHSELHLFEHIKIDGQKTVFIKDKKWFKYPSGFSTLKDEQNKTYGTNSYSDMWFKQDVFNGLPIETKVSVIIPTHNYSNYLCDAIDSALNQTYKNVEVIVVDDGSTDDTNEIIKKYESKIQYIYQENSGVAKARNRGIEVSSGSWILTLDADDLIDPNYIETALKLIQNEQSLITSRAYFYDTDMNPIEKFYPEGTIDLNKTKLHNMIKENYVVTTSLFSKSMWQKTGGYNENLKRAEDWEFWVNMIKNGASVTYMEGKQYFKYRFHKNSKSNKLINELKDTVEYINRTYKGVL